MTRSLTHVSRLNLVENCVNAARKCVTTLFLVPMLGMLSAEVSSTLCGNGRMRKSSV